MEEQEEIAKIMSEKADTSKLGSFAPGEGRGDQPWPDKPETVVQGGCAKSQTMDMQKIRNAVKFNALRCWRFCLQKKALAT